MVVLLTLLLATGGARAEDAGGAAAYEQAGTRSPAEKAQFASSAQDEIKAHIEHVEALLEAAQKDRKQDVIECLSRKLQPMQTLQVVVKGDAEALAAAQAGTGTGDADAIFRKIAVALGKVRDFRTDADACVGDTGANRGNSLNYMQDAPSLVDVESLIDDPWEEADDVPPDPSPN